MTISTKKLNQNSSNKLDMKDNKGVGMKDNKGVDEKKDSESEEGKSKRDNNLQNFPLNKKFHQQILKRIKKRKTVQGVLAHKSIKKAKETHKDGWHDVTKKLKEKKGRTKMYTCLVSACNFQKQSKAAVLRHIKKKHPNFRWKCHRCTKSFVTKVGCYKHELHHKYGFCYECNQKGCGYCCMFKSEMEEHCWKHKSDSQKEWFKCRKAGGCTKSYPAKRSRNAHEKMHTAKDWTCEANIEDGKTCGQECVSHVHLAQHICGLHGLGWDSKCGKNFKWPSSKYAHEGECTVCKKIKKKNVRKLH